MNLQTGSPPPRFSNAILKSAVRYRWPDGLKRSNFKRLPITSHRRRGRSTDLKEELDSGKEYRLDALLL
ncbi:unnamed protein product [Anisakis simplex]|uniref:Uncharacterized protein n=1 Tax=Anisakis simplex TaxID=6269 RepID=A0A0M3KFW8_ANISI|nr:unnamed protein product [Anisakis simplex]